MKDVISLIDDAFDTPARRWISSPYVTRFCEQLRKEKKECIENKKCACGNDCTGDELETLGFFGEYICRECV